MPGHWMLVGVVPLVVAAALIACGGDGEETAQDLIPNLSSEGLAVIQEGPDEFLPAELDNYRALYQAEDGRAVIVLVYVDETNEEAAGRYATLSEALENPPPEFFGGEAAQDDEAPLAIGDESRAFVTAEADNSGNRVWTDIYRSGKVTVITQVLAASESVEELRTTIAERVI